MEAAQPYPLRSLNIGEIFDRAITIYVRHFVPLTLMVMTLVVPLIVAQALAAPDQSQGLEQVLRDIQNPKGANPVANSEFGTLVLLGFVTFLLLPIVNSAVAVGVASIYNSKAPSYGRSFGVVFRHIWSVLGSTLLYIGMIVGVYLGCVTIFAIVFAIGLMLMHPYLPLAIIVLIVAALIVLAIIAALMLLVMGLAFATYAAAIESKGAIAAVSLSFRRLFTRKEIGKALLMALAYVALNIGVLALSGTVSLLVEWLTHSHFVDLAMNAVVSAASGALLTVLLAVYYYDVRTRSEGLDLEVELAQLTSA